MPSTRTLGRQNQPSFDRVPLDIPLDLRKFLVIPNPVIIAFVLPERATAAEDPVRPVGHEAFERSQPMVHRNGARHQQMNMIRHHDKGTQGITSEAFFGCNDGIDSGLRDFGISGFRRKTGPVAAASCSFFMATNARPAFRLPGGKTRGTGRLP
jgi:hypothetical protein